MIRFRRNHIIALVIIIAIISSLIVLTRRITSPRHNLVQSEVMLDDTTFTFMSDDIVIRDLHYVWHFDHDRSYQNAQVQIDVVYTSHSTFYATIVDVNDHDRVLGVSNQFSIIADEFIEQH